MDQLPSAVRGAGRARSGRRARLAFGFSLPPSDAFFLTCMHSEQPEEPRCVGSGSLILIRLAL